MQTTFGVLLVAVAVGIWFYRGIRKVPVGYQDGNGFHPGAQISGEESD